VDLSNTSLSVLPDKKSSKSAFHFIFVFFQIING